MVGKPSTYSTAAVAPLTRYYTTISVLVILLALFYVSTSLLNLSQHKLQLEDQTCQQLQNTVLIVRRSLALQLQNLSTQQRLIGNKIAEQFPDDLTTASKAQVASLQALMTRELSRTDDVEFFGVTDADGRIVYISENVAAFSINDSIDVSKLRASSDNNIAITIYNMFPDDDSPRGFLITQAVRRDDGSLKAFVFALQSHQSLTQNLAAEEHAGFSLGQHTLIAIYETQTNRLAFRYPAGSSVVGEIIPNIFRTPFRNLSQFSFTVSPYDHIKRLTLETPLQYGPFTLRLAMAESDYLTPWYDELRSLGLSFLMLAFAVILLFYLLKQGREQTQQLEYDKEQFSHATYTLQKLINTAPVALVHVRREDGLLLQANPAFERLFGAADKQPGYAHELFCEESVWGELVNSLEVQKSAKEKVMEARIKIRGKYQRHALMSVAYLPAPQKNQAEFLLSFTDMESQFERRKALHKIAYTDALTNLPNRRAFFEKYETLFCLGSESKTFAILMVDLDHFKKINDNYGHSAGDAVLAHTAGCLLASLRASDFPARLGGEEFVILLPDTQQETALKIAERVRYNIENSAPAIFEGNCIRITASIGVAVCRSPVSDTQSILNCADEALYKAKNAGRNCVVLADGVELLV